MAKAIVLGLVDADPGVDDNNYTLLAKVLFLGATVPGNPLIDMGPNGNGVAIPYTVTMTAAQYSNSVETALINRAAALGFTIVATDVIFNPWTRGS